MLNRAVILVRYKQPFIDWINAADPHPSHEISAESAGDDATAYLVEVEDREELDEWLELNAETLFESELEGWYTDPALWPKDRSLATFKAWCTLELHTMVVDTGGAPLYDDDDDEDEGA